MLPGEHADRPNRIAHYWLDLARAWLLHGNRDHCVDALGRARAISPEHIRYNPSLHETIATLAAQDARRTDSFPGLARWAGSASEPPARRSQRHLVGNVTRTAATVGTALYRELAEEFGAEVATRSLAGR